MKLHALSILATGLVICDAALAAFPTRPILVWNVTASAPIGLYRKSGATIGVGSWLLIRPPKAAATLAAERHYLPDGVPMIKRVAAEAGDRICALGTTITVNGAPTAVALARDQQGRELPRWKECRKMRRDELFLLNRPSDSFDSRYFGPVTKANTIERIEPLWTF